ncbi:fimbrial protein [Acinetobacter puyangensis]|uniref:fimbrial protein n=1 Tax=Acinetobacter puyangensis TaxID=1096779 RepID=UPI003A4DE53A
MNKNFGLSLGVIIGIVSLCVESEGWAACRSVHYNTGEYAGVTISGNVITEGGATGASWWDSNTTQTEDNDAARISIGKIHLMDNAIQPNGSSLAIASVPPTAYKIRNTYAESLLWACSPSTDMSKIRFLVSVNGDDRVGGYFPVDPVNAGGETNVFYTWFKYVGIRQYIDGQVLGRQYKGIPIQYETGAAGSVGWAKDKCQPGWHCIRLKHLPTMQFELLRVAGQPPYSSSANGYCNFYTTPSNATGNDLGMGQYGNYNCNQPISYITLGESVSTSGSPNGNEYVAFAHDAIGITHTTAGDTWYFWGADNGFGYTLYNSAYLDNTASACKLNMVTPAVNFGPTSIRHLNNNNVISRDFQIQVDCHNAAVSGTQTNQVAIGIQPSQGAYNAAQAFSPTLVNASNGVSALLSDDYSINTLRAKNVGIYIKYQGDSNYITLLGQPGATGSTPVTSGHHSVSCGSINNQACYSAVTFPQGNAAGWYPILNHAANIGTPLSGYTRYNINYTADLKKIDSAPAVTLGSIYSTATVVVKIQ